MALHCPGCGTASWDYFDEHDQPRLVTVTKACRACADIETAQAQLKEQNLPAPLMRGMRISLETLG